MRIATTLSLVLLTVAPMTVSAQTTAAKKLTSADSEFITTAAANNQFEIAAGKLAQSKGSSGDVKSFGSMLVKDHSGAFDKLSALAKGYGMTLKTDFPAEKQKTLDALNKLTGTAFDREFMKDVGLDAHKSNLELHEKAASNAEAADVKSFASGATKTIRMHYDMAQKISSGLKQ